MPSNRAQRRAIQREEKKAAKKAAKKGGQSSLPVPSKSIAATIMKNKEAVKTRENKDQTASPSPSLPLHSLGHEVAMVIPTEETTAEVPAVPENLIDGYPTTTMTILDIDPYPYQYHPSGDNYSVITDRSLSIVINEEEEVMNDEDEDEDEESRENETGTGGTTEAPAHFLAPLTSQTEVTQTSLPHQEQHEEVQHADDDEDNGNNEAEEMISDNSSQPSSSSFLSLPSRLKTDHAQLSIGSDISNSDIVGSLDNRGSEQTLVANEPAKMKKSSKSTKFHKVLLTSLKKKMRKEKIPSSEKLPSSLSPALKKNNPWKFWKKEGDSRVTIV
ncbi:hypothetical protein [Absidia glauca]|uniref:Uncharacterized protein n=1 Tax=Absidia glauca TaxID=4829 RepID=A0A168TCD2_ABSGL|nr:hypothetical protein [Absidia glauca]